ncbi:MAG: hypothetical protein OCU22_09395 [Canidatus Methanoxibalbensis ujae]|nr:hypothetical protein [Candidatus Methanoxibalbensis ujae]
MKSKRLTSVNAMPAEAIILGSDLSESLPAYGEKMIITTGWEVKIRPAF